MISTVSEDSCFLGAGHTSTTVAPITIPGPTIPEWHDSQYDVVPKFQIRLTTLSQRKRRRRCPSQIGLDEKGQIYGRR